MSLLYVILIRPDILTTYDIHRWLRTSGLEDDSASHLKRIRKSQVTNTSSLLLALTSASPGPPTLPEEMKLPEPYIATVPKLPALTQTSLKLKSTLWPTIYAPKRKHEVEPWSRGKLRWAWKAMQTVVAEAKIVKFTGEVRVQVNISWKQFMNRL